MGVYFNDKHKGNTPWYMKVRYKDSENKPQVKIKRGFRTKTEALKFEKSFLQDITADKEYAFEKVVEFYIETKKNHSKQSTMYTKTTVINKFILPEFTGKDIRKITPRDLTRWQNKELFEKDAEGKNIYNDTYIRSVNGQMRAIFNFAVSQKYIEESPMDTLPNIGRKKTIRNYVVWSPDQIATFLQNIPDYEDAYMAFMILFYTGLRKGELLALTLNDIDFENRILHVSKTYSVIQKNEVITTPKTETGIRDVPLPEFLCEQIQLYIKHIYKPDGSQRLFNHQRSGKFLETAMNTGCKRTGLTRTRIHDTRHSHITILSEMYIPNKEIAKRVGQNGENMVIHYSHSTVAGQDNLTKKLQEIGGESFV